MTSLPQYEQRERAELVALLRARQVPGANLASTWSLETLHAKAAESALHGKRNKLVLGGGAQLGLAHPGAIKCLDDYGVDTREQCDLVGISVGAIVGMFHVNGYGPEEISEILARELRFLNLGAVPTMLRGAIPPLNPLHWLQRPGVFDPLSLTRRWQRQYRWDSTDKLTLLGYDPNNKSTVEFTGSYEPDIAVACAIAVPVLFRPVLHNLYGTRSITVIDKGFHHPHPAYFGTSDPTIVLKLFHGTIVDAIWPDKPSTYPVNIGDTRMLPFGRITQDKVTYQFDRGYNITNTTLGGSHGPIARGKFVMRKQAA